MLHANQGGGQVTWMGQQEVKQSKETWSLINTDAQEVEGPGLATYCSPRVSMGMVKQS